MVKNQTKQTALKQLVDRNALAEFKKKYQHDAFFARRNYVIAGKQKSF
jgi:hypothetical protein